MKYFYSIVIDGYSYAEVTEVRYKNEIDFMYHKLPEAFDEVTNTNCENVWDYLDSTEYYPSGDCYVAMDENGKVLEELESNQDTFNYIKKDKNEHLSIEELSKKIGNDCLDIIRDEFAGKTNNPILRKIITSKIDYYFNELKDSQHIKEYKIKCDESNNDPSTIKRNGLKVNIAFKSNYGLYSIPLEL